MKTQKELTQLLSQKVSEINLAKLPNAYVTYFQAMDTAVRFFKNELEGEGKDKFLKNLEDATNALRRELQK